MVQMFMRGLKKMSALSSARFRVSALERFCYKGFLKNSSGTKFFVRLREVSALEDVRLREVSLYFNLTPSPPTRAKCNMNYTKTMISGAILKLFLPTSDMIFSIKENKSLKINRHYITAS